MTRGPCSSASSSGSPSPLSSWSSALASNVSGRSNNHSSTQRDHRVPHGVTASELAALQQVTLLTLPVARANVPLPAVARMSAPGTIRGRQDVYTVSLPRRGPETVLAMAPGGPRK